MVVTERADFALFVEIVSESDVAASGAFEQQSLGDISLFLIVLGLICIEPDLDH